MIVVKYKRKARYYVDILLQSVTYCSNDTDYQSSTNTMSAHWTLPHGKEHFMQDIFWAVEERAALVEFWTVIQDFQHLTSRNHLHAASFFLVPGRQYRLILKPCAGQFCFRPVYSNGFTVIPHPPKSGDLDVVLDSSEQVVQ